MEFSTTSEQFLIHSTKAYYNFKKYQIPFAAVKIYFSGLGCDRIGIANIIKNNFRSEKDVILKNENNYAVLMHNTSLQAAETVINRIARKLSRLTRNNLKTNIIFQRKAYAYIYGAGKEKNRLQFRYLDLAKTLCKKDNAEELRPRIREYGKCFKPIKRGGYKTLSIKV